MTTTSQTLARLYCQRTDTRIGSARWRAEHGVRSMRREFLPVDERNVYYVSVVCPSGHDFTYMASEAAREQGVASVGESRLWDRLAHAALEAAESECDAHPLDKLAKQFRESIGQR